LVSANHREALSYGNDVGSVRPNLIGWGREEGSGAALILVPTTAPDFLLKK